MKKITTFSPKVMFAHGGAMDIHNKPLILAIKASCEAVTAMMDRDGIPLDGPVNGAYIAEHDTIVVFVNGKAFDMDYNMGALYGNPDKLFILKYNDDVDTQKEYMRRLEEAVGIARAQQKTFVQTANKFKN